MEITHLKHLKFRPKKNITPEKIRSIVPHILSRIGKPEVTQGNISQVITIIDYDPNRHLFRFEYNNKEGVFSEYAKSTILLSRLKLKQKGNKRELQHDEEICFISGMNDVSLENLMPESTGAKLSPEKHLKALSQMLQLYAVAILEQTVLKENETQGKTLRALAARSDKTAATAEALSEILSNDEKLTHFLIEHIGNLEKGPITLPFGYYREGQFIPLFINLERKKNTIEIQTVVIDPALKRKVIPFQAYTLQVNENSEKRLYNILRSLAQFTKQIPETKESKGASPLEVMNVAMQIASGGAGQLQKIKDQLKALDIIDEMILTKQTDNAKLKKAFEMLSPIDFTSFDPKTANQASKDFLVEKRKKLNSEKAKLETPKVEWTSDKRDVFTIIESFLVESGAVKRPSEAALVTASHDRFKIVSNWLFATAIQPEHFKQISNDIEANITTRLINHNLARLDSLPSISHKLKTIDHLENLMDRYIKHRKKEIRDEKRLLQEIEAVFGPFQQAISKIKKTLVQQAHTVLNSTIEEPKWSYKIRENKEIASPSKVKGPAFPLIEFENLRTAIGNAKNIKDLSTALTVYTEKCKALYEDYNYPELIKAVNAALELLPVPSSGSLWSRAEDINEVDAISKSVTTLTQYAWEAHLKTGRKGCYPNEVVNLLNTRAILTKLLQKQALYLQGRPRGNLTKEEKQLLVYANYTCDTEQAIHLLTKQAYLRYARDPNLEIKTMALLRFYQHEKDSELGQVTLDSYRHMVEDKTEQRFLTEIAAANGIVFDNEDKQSAFWVQAWSNNWHREEKNAVLPKLGIDLRRHALFTQTMLHAEWVMVKGFESDYSYGLSKAMWLGAKLSEAAAESGETDAEILLKIISNKELTNLKENIYSMDHLDLILGEDSEKGFENAPAINFTDRAKKYQVGYHPRGFIAAELRNPYHDAALIGQTDKIPEQFIATRTTVADSVDDAKSKRKREMESLQPTTELTILQEEQYNPSTNLSEVQNAQLRGLIVDSASGNLVSPLTFMNVFHYIWQNPDQLLRGAFNSSGFSSYIS